MNGAGAMRAHVIYRRRWLLAFLASIFVAMAWGAMIANESNGWGQMGMWLLFSAAPGVVGGPLTGGLIMAIAIVRTPRALRRATLGPMRGRFLDAVVLSLGTAAMATALSYVSGFIALNIWAKGGC